MADRKDTVDFDLVTELALAMVETQRAFDREGEAERLAYAGAAARVPGPVRDDLLPALLPPRMQLAKSRISADLVVERRRGTAFGLELSPLNVSYGLTYDVRAERASSITLEIERVRRVAGEETT